MPPKHTASTTLIGSADRSKNGISDHWRRHLHESFTQAEALFEFLELDPALLPQANAAARSFALRVSRSYAERIEKGNIGDPLLRQVLPLGDELERRPGFTHDPVGELAASSSNGIVHKYRGRALLITAGACAVNCRYCFRRHYPYAGNLVTPQRWTQTLAYLDASPDIDEVIFSGGDPLVLDDSKLSAMAKDLARIPHLARMRIHSRLPIMIPQRINQELIDWIVGTRLTPVMVLHCNHPHELSGTVVTAVSHLRSAGITLLNQSVLLKGVNDDGATLCELSLRLFAAGVLPYYLHLLDRVQGSAHFEVPQEKIQDLQQEIRARLPGYLVPKLVREEPGMKAKIPFDP